MVSFSVASPAPNSTSWLSLSSLISQSLPAGPASVTVAVSAAAVEPSRLSV